jgi:hypothetical protein
VLVSFDGVSDAQWKFKAGADRWSIGECAKHIVAVVAAMFSIVSQQLLEMPPPANAVKRADSAVLEAGTDRGTKVKTTEFLEPKGAKRPSPT